MDNNQGLISCGLGCWMVAALGGVLTAGLLWVLGGWSFMQGAFIGLLVLVVAGALLSWILCRPLPAAGEVQQRSASTDNDTAARTPAAAPASAPAAAAPAAAAAAKPAPVELKPTAELKGEAELAERKGNWKYEGDNATAAKDKPAAAPSAEPTPSAAAPAAPEPVVAAEGPGSKPETLTAARDGQPDDLKQIKGVGPKLEALLHSMGFYHFDQVASWGAEEVAWVDQNLQGFKGRVSRDNWVSQAKILAEGGETEFSKKVGKGGVY
ncbi:MAG: hypothetical protein AAFV87_08235 [Pseudomonadota bacterium]